jgi:putative addiction module killer protein
MCTGIAPAIFTLAHCIQLDTMRTWTLRQRKSSILGSRAFVIAKPPPLSLRAIIRIANGLLGDVKSVGGAVSELRIDFGPGYRVYFTRKDNELVILLCGGDKATQDKDIKLAHQLAKNL